MENDRAARYFGYECVGCFAQLLISLGEINAMKIMRIKLYD